jgi:gas vesicle protein
MKNDKPSSYQRKRSAAKWMTLSAAVGAAVGAIAALLYAPKAGSALRKDLKKQWSISKREADKQIRKAFGVVSPDAEKAYDEFKNTVMQRLGDLQSPLTKEAYHDIVDAAAAQLSRNRQDLEQAYETLKKEWKKMYRRITK